MRVLADGLELELALSCLIENALDAGSKSISLQCGVHADGRAAIAIVDDGSGFVGGSNKRALDPFFTTKPGRLGLGLNIAKRIAFRAKGEFELAARTDAERGVRATLLIPRTED
jgi:C4-dicarboxylate-specific signal transduction histidine kinase